MRQSLRLPWQLWGLLALLALLLGAQYAWVSPLPGRDSGVYLYHAQQLLAGRRLYVELWDHKPPLIYWVDALGLLLSGGRLWGVRVLEALSLALGLGLAWDAARRAAGAGPASAVCAAGLWYLQTHMEGGNLPESFLLLPAGALLWLALGRLDGRRSAVAGVLAAGLLAFKFNLLGLPLFAAWRAREDGRLGAYFGGAGAGFALLLGWLLAQGSLEACFDQVWTYNAAYAVNNFASRRHAFKAGLRQTAWVGLLPLAGLAWSVLKGTPEARRLRALGLAFLVDLLLVSLPGREYPHSYLPLLTTLLVPAAAGLDWLGKRLPRAALGLGLVAALAVFMVANGQRLRRSSLPYQAELAWMEQNLEPGEPVLLWGAFTALHFLSGHPSPCVMHYQYGLYTEGYTRPEQVDEFRRQLLNSGARWIVDLSAAESIVPPLDPEAARAWKPLMNYKSGPHAWALREELLRDFAAAGVLPGTAWRLYRRRTSQRTT